MRERIVMKKLLKISLIVMIMLTMAFSLTGCALLDIFKQIGDLDDLGDLGNLGGNTNDETYTADMKSKTEIKNALGDNYEITLKYGYTSSEDEDGASVIKTKRVGDAYYTVVESEGETETYLVVGNKAYTEYDEEAEKFKSCSQINEYNPYTNVFEQLMTGHENSLTYNTKKSDKLLGRNVTVYKWTQTTSVVVASVSYEWEYVVDDATGLLMKQSMSFSGSSIEGSTSASACFEVTAMQLGGQNLTQEMQMIGVDDWPTAADFSVFGVPAVAKIEGEFISAYAIIEDTGIASSKEYVYKLTDGAIFDTLCQNFYQSGFKKDSDCEEKALAELLEEYTDAKEYRGYIGELGCYTDFGVNIRLESPYYEGGKYTLTITLYNHNAMGD